MQNFSSTRQNFADETRDTLINIGFEVDCATEHLIRESKQKFSIETEISRSGLPRGYFLEPFMPTEDQPPGASVTEGIG